MQTNHLFSFLLFSTLMTKQEKKGEREYEKKSPLLSYLHLSSLLDILIATSALFIQ